MSATVSLSGMFLEGLLAFFSPCVIGILPLYFGYITANHTAGRVKTFIYTVCFVLGISTVYFLMGLGASSFSIFFMDHALVFSMIGGMCLIFAGLVTTGVVQIPYLLQDHRFSFQRKAWMSQAVFAFLLGFFFSFAWTPCVGPMMASALIVAAGAETRTLGMSYIAVYTLGFVITFLILGLFTEEVLNLISKKKSILRYSQIVGGLLIICMGIYMVYDASKTITQIQRYGSSSSNVETQTEYQEDTSLDDEIVDAIKHGFTLYDYEGNPVSLTDYAGKTVIVNFFGTWCYYCNVELPELQHISDTHEDVEVLLIAAPGLNGEGDPEYVENYMNENGYDMKIVYDMDYSVSSHYGVSGYPTSCILKPDQNFLGCANGYVPEETMESYLEEAKSE